MSLNPLFRIVNRVKARTAPFVVTAIVDTPITADHALYGGVVVSNLGAAGTVVFQMPPATPGMRIRAITETAQSLRLLPATGQTLSSTAGVTQTANFYAANATVGSYIGYVCLRAGTWDVEVFNGTYTHA